MSVSDSLKTLKNSGVPVHIRHTKTAVDIVAHAGDSRKQSWKTFSQYSLEKLVTINLVLCLYSEVMSICIT